MSALPETSPPHPPATPAGTPADGCWSREGVYGNNTCPELVRFVHCRNCPVHAEAGASLLDRPLPNNYRHEWTRHFVRPWKRSPGSRTSVLFFRLAKEWFALPVQVFQEVAESRPIHSLPGKNQGIVLGVVSFRGEIVVCVSLGHLLGVDGLPSRDTLRLQYPRLLVVSWEGKRLCFPVDEVHGVHRVVPDEVGPAPASGLKSGPRASGIIRWRHRTTGLLDPRLLFAALNRDLS